MPPTWLKKGVSNLLWKVLGRRTYARVGRFLWMESRLDVGNNMATNGEALVQEAFVRRRGPSTTVTVLDVGANLGDWTQSLFDLFRQQHRATPDSLHIHLFEPSPPTYAHLERRAQSWPTSATLVNAAVASEAGTASLAVFGDKDGIHTLSPLPGDVPRSVVDVQVTAVDTYAREHGLSHIDFLKIDTEGNDYNVLAGARQLLREKRVSLIQFEYNHRWVPFRRYLKDVFDLLLPLGYRIGKITPRGIEAYESWHPELESFREGNYLAWLGDLDLPLPRIKWWNDGPPQHRS